MVKSEQLKLSKEQELFISEALSGKNILVDACIGSGKTTSIQYLCSCYPDSKRILYLTYNHLLKKDAQKRIRCENAVVDNYHGFAYGELKKRGEAIGVSDTLKRFVELRPDVSGFDVLIIDEYQDIDTEISRVLEYIKVSNPGIQIIAVGDMCQKIYDRTTRDELSRTF